MNKAQSPKDYVVKVVSSYDKETNMETISVYVGSENDLVLGHQQIRPLFMRNREGCMTFVDKFLDTFNIFNSSPKRIDQFENIVNDGGGFIYFINNVRLKRLNFLGKFYFFLLKKIFLHGKASPVEEIKGILRYYEKKSFTSKPQV